VSGEFSKVDGLSSLLEQLSFAVGFAPETFSNRIRTMQMATPDSQILYDAFNASPIGIVLENLEGQPLFVNPFFCSMLGFSEEEMRSKHCVEFSPPEDAEKDWALFQQLRAGLIDHYEMEKRFIRRDGSLVWGRLRISLLNRASPLVLAIVQDITEKRTGEEAQSRHAAIVESSEDAIISKNLDGVIQSWNAGGQRIFGYLESEVVGQPIAILIPAELLDEEQKILERLRAGERIEHYETVRVTKAGKRVAVSVSISAIKDSSGRIVGFSNIARDITERKLAEEALEDVSRKLVEIQERERTRIARDLHDDINQRLAMLAVEIEELKRNPPTSAAELYRQLTDVWEGINEVSTGVQSISHQLHSPQLEYLGVAAAMKNLCGEFALRQTVEIDFKNDDIPQFVSHEVSLCLFRILQEALQNAAKHSKVRRFEVRLGCSSDQLYLTVSDRGAGFDAKSAMNKAGLGLVSMRERVRLVSGTILIDSKPLGGTNIHVRVPLGSEPSSQRRAG
jgi:PAS domain S-box-containing protein